jgi:ubiquitin related modifier 1
MSERHDLFMQGNSIRPGILVLINEVDWELENTIAYKLSEGDTIAFISTLHGG